MSIIDVISDYSNKKLNSVPTKILEMFNLKMLYLEGNIITELPEDFFKKLSRLTWLDLRRNHIKRIPVEIGDHLCLETLLLQDNQIQELPNELGLVPNLKVLQLSGNPLKYPLPEIIQAGVQTICNYLKQEYYKSTEVEIAEDDEEKEICVTEPKSSSTYLSESREKLSVRDILKRSGKQSHLFSVMPVIDVKSLSKEPPKEGNVQIRDPDYYALRPGPVKKTHRMSKNSSMISLKSSAQLEVKKKRSNEIVAQESELKDMWLKRLKDLLADQEKILQREKNLTNLNNWRLKRKIEPPRTSLEELSPPPFDTDPDLQMLSRKDLSERIDKMLKDNKKPSKKSKRVDIQNLIDQVVEQMKNMEKKLSSSTPTTPRTQQELAARQIHTIVDLHKKIMNLKTKNDTTLT